MVYDDHTRLKTCTGLSQYIIHCCIIFKRKVNPVCTLYCICNIIKRLSTIGLQCLRL